MRSIRFGRLAACCLAGWGIAGYTAAGAVEPVQAIVEPGAGPAVQAAVALPLAADCHCTVVPALTPIEIEIMAPVGSKLSKTGETFPIRLAQAVRIGDREILPAGLTGMGEVVHAKASGGGGSGGELVLAARYLDMANGRIKLRSMRMASVGKDQTGLAIATAMAVGIFGMAVKGKNTEIPAGTIALAKIAQDFAIADTGAPAIAASPAVPAAARGLPVDARTVAN